MPNLFIIAGPNGAGKTTAAMTLLPEFLHVREFVNADGIAHGLSPLNPGATDLLAGRLMMQRILQLYAAGEDFAFETTLASRTFAPFVKRAQRGGYKVHLLFLWLPSPEFAMKRVALRVKSGGHNIAKSIIVRRYHGGLKNLFALYMPIVDTWHIYDSAGKEPIQIARKISHKPIIEQEELWQNLVNSHH